MTIMTVTIGLASMAAGVQAAPPQAAPAQPARAQATPQAAPSAPPRAAPAAPPAPAAVPAPSLWGEHFQVDLTLLDIGGAPLVHRQFDVALGQTQTVSENHQGRTTTVDASFSAGDRVGCVATKLVVVDRRIDTTGQFGRTDWSSTVQSCDHNPLTVGHVDQVRVRFSMKPADGRSGAARSAK